MRRSLGLKADLIIANSKKGVTYWLENGAPEGRVSYVPNIVAVDGKGGCSGRSVGTRKRVIFAGRMERQKNVLAIAEAFCRLSLEYTDVDFMLIGNGGLVEEVRSVVNDCKNVIQLPFQKNIIDFYKEALVFVNVSLHEGMPNTVMENIALGNRVVVSKIDEHVALLGPGYKYYVSDLCCVDEIAQIVRDALQSHRVEDDYVFAKSVMAGMTGVGVSSKYMELFRQLALK
ncbi:MAG: glycosyltransferase family 4 protein [Proteobacteria bacterium]|nr:glycosyltransferase family 4 protein [Pseudomonadota bacterium]